MLVTADGADEVADGADEVADGADEAADVAVLVTGVTVVVGVLESVAGAAVVVGVLVSVAGAAVVLGVPVSVAAAVVVGVPVSVAGATVAVSAGTVWVIVSVPCVITVVTLPARGAWLAEAEGEGEGEAEAEGAVVFEVPTGVVPVVDGPDITLRAITVAAIIRAIATMTAPATTAFPVYQGGGGGEPCSTGAA